MQNKVSAMPARWAPEVASFLGLQHMFAMFGATVLVPALTGLSVSATLLFAGLGTLFFHFLTKGKVPAFLGSSFAYLAGYAAIAPERRSRASPLRLCGRRRFRPAVSDSRGAGARLRREPRHAVSSAGRHRPDHHRHRHDAANSAINNCTGSWDIALVAILTVVIFNIRAGACCASSRFCWACSSPMFTPPYRPRDFSGVASRVDRPAGEDGKHRPPHRQLRREPARHRHHRHHAHRVRP